MRIHSGLQANTVVAHSQHPTPAVFSTQVNQDRSGRVPWISVLQGIRDQLVDDESTRNRGIDRHFSGRDLDTQAYAARVHGERGEQIGSDVVQVLSDVDS